MMARKRDINDIDEDDDGQIVDYSGDSDDDNKSKEDLPEEAFRRRPAPDLGALDTSQPLQYNILREDGELLVRSNQAFRGETMPMGVDLPKPSTHLTMLEKLQELFPEMVEGVQWDITEGGFRNVLDFLASIRVAELAKILDDEKEAMKDDLAAAEAKLASNDAELHEAHEEVSRVRHEQQLLQQQVTDLNTRAEQIRTSHIAALKEADERSRNLERSKAESDRSMRDEINRLSRQLAIRE